MHSHPSPSGVVFQLRARVGRSWCRTARPDMNARFFPATEDYGHYEELPGEPGEHLFPEHPLEPDSSASCFQQLRGKDTSFSRDSQDQMLGHLK